MACVLTNINKKKLFSYRLRFTRESKGFSTLDMANKLKIGRSTYNNWENGARSPKIEDLMEIATILGVSVDYLLYLTDDPTVYEEDHTNINNYLTEDGIHFDGIPLTHEELEPLREFLGAMVNKKKIMNKKVI